METGSNSEASTDKSLETSLAQTGSKALSNSEAVTLAELTSESKLQATAEAMLESLSSGANMLEESVTGVHLSDANSPVKKPYAIFLLVFAMCSIVACCASTTFCVRAARDSNIAVNALSIRRKYHRNMQLYMLVKEKMMIDRRA